MPLHDHPVPFHNTKSITIHPDRSEYIIVGIIGDNKENMISDKIVAEKINQQKRKSNNREEDEQTVKSSNSSYICVGYRKNQIMNSKLCRMSLCSFCKGNQ